MGLHLSHFWIARLPRIKPILGSSNKNPMANQTACCSRPPKLAMAPRTPQSKGGAKEKPPSLFCTKYAIKDIQFKAIKMAERDITRMHPKVKKPPPLAIWVSS